MAPGPPSSVPRLSAGRVGPGTIPGFQPPLIEPDVRFSLIRLSCRKSGPRRLPPHPVVSIETQRLVQVGVVVPLPPVSVPMGSSLEYAA